MSYSILLNKCSGKLQENKSFYALLRSHISADDDGELNAKQFEFDDEKWTSLPTTP